MVSLHLLGISTYFLIFTSRSFWKECYQKLMVQAIRSGPMILIPMFKQERPGDQPDELQFVLATHPWTLQNKLIINNDVSRYTFYKEVMIPHHNFILHKALTWLTKGPHQQRRKRSTAGHTYFGYQQRRYTEHAHGHLLGIVNLRST